MRTIIQHDGLKPSIGDGRSSGAGLLLSGNVQVDRWHLERPGNIVIDDESGLEALKSLAKAGTAGGVHFWLQLSHTGRQVSDAINQSPLSSSNVEICCAARSRAYVCTASGDDGSGY